MKWLLNLVLPLVVLCMPRDPDARAYCVSLARKGDCDFYDNCIEKWTQTCGSSGYALRYGGKYCRKFMENLELFSEAVRIKMPCVFVIIFIYIFLVIIYIFFSTAW